MLPAVPAHRVRSLLAHSSAAWADLLVLSLVASALGGLLLLGRDAIAPIQERMEIDLSWSALPYYTVLSLGRGFAAYALSLLFTLTYGTYAAHHPRAERFMLPVLDVLQAIPVLGFLPGLVLAMMALSPTRQFGLELACIVMIFTGQVWNLTFSYHASLKTIPPALREVAAVQRLSSWRVFRLLEVPASMIGLVWNSMMSMAGGWFFLTVNEAFTLGHRDFRLPGIGSYMNEAIHQGDMAATIAAVVAMVTMIVAVDQFFWRPIVVWSQRFKMGDSADAVPTRSWVVDWFRRSRLAGYVARRWAMSRRSLVALRPVDTGSPTHERVPARRDRSRFGLVTVARRVVVGAMLVIIAWGLFALARLVFALPLRNASTNNDWLHVLLALAASFARTSTAVFLGMAWTLPVGILIGRSPRWSQRLQPVLQVLASFPAPMVFPLVTLLLVWLHVPFTWGCVALMLLGAQWYILFNVIAGATAIPADLQEVAAVYGLSQWRRWTRLYLPSVFPYLVTGLVTAAGGAWNATIVSEYVQLHGETYSAFGLGSLISQATADANFPLLAASVLTMASFVVLWNRLFWKRLYRLAQGRYSLES